jgi:hypothetical protein
MHASPDFYCGSVTAREAASSADSDVRRYVIIIQLQHSLSNMQWELKFPYWRSHWTQDFSSVSLPTWNWLRSVGIATGWTIRARFPAGARDFFFFHSVRTGSGAHPVSYPMGTGGSFPGGKAAEAWSRPLTSIQCRAQEWCSYTSTAPYIFIAWCLCN